MSWTDFFSSVRSVMSTRLFEIGGTSVTVSTLAVVLLVILFTFITSVAVRRGTKRALMRRSVHEGTIAAINGLVHYLVLVIGLSVGLQTLGINLTALFAAGAVFAVGLGFAMKNIAENFVSGVILLVERSIRPGDIIDVEQQVVKVVRMGIRATLVQGRDGEHVIMPNSTLVQSAVTNYTLETPVYRTRIPVGVVYSSNMEQVHDALTTAARQAMSEIDGITDRTPDIIMTDFGDNSVNFEVGMWVGDPWRERPIRSRVSFLIWNELKARDITIAFPQLDVHFDPPVAKGFESIAKTAA